MARTKVNLNRSGMGDLLNDDGVVGDLETRMGRALAQAVTNAPVATGEYRDSLRVETVRHPSRTVVRLVSDSDHAMGVEAATGNLARSLDATGGG